MPVFVGVAGWLEELGGFDGPGAGPLDEELWLFVLLLPAGELGELWVGVEL